MAVEEGILRAMESELECESERGRLESKSSHLDGGVLLTSGAILCLAKESRLKGCCFAVLYCTLRLSCMKLF
jgi:hypothetical protein